MTTHRYLWITVLSLWTFTSAVGQTGAGLVLRPWPDHSRSQIHAGVMVLNKGRTDNSNASFRLERYDVSGRWRAQENHQHPAVSIGFDASYLNLATSDPALPDRLVDQSVAAGWTIGQSQALQLVVGVGYAGDLPYSDSDALYGQANLIYTRQIDPQTQLQIILNYDGSRAFLPDIPLPSLSYRHQATEGISYAIGFPANIFHWQPSHRLSVHAMYVVPVTVKVAVEYELASGWYLFGRVDSQLDAFTLDGAPEHRRLFFQQRKIEIGVQLRSDQNVDLTLAAGYVSGQEFSTGFDVRDLDDVAEPSDEPYVRVAVQLRF